MLKDDNNKWNDDEILLNTLTRACKISNDVLKPRLPIHENLLELILFETECLFCEQPYLEILYKTIFSIGYYGLLRIGELVKPCEHTMKACNVHVGKNKEKILIVLYTSKTHGRESYPQEIKISSHSHGSRRNKFFCPFMLIKQYLRLRGSYNNDNEPFFVFRDKSPVLDYQLRKTLRKLICNLGLNAEVFDIHSLRIGRSSELFKRGFSVEQIKKIGCWKSNAIYKYLQN